MQAKQLSPTAESYLSGLKADPELSVSEWSDQFRFLSSKSSSEPGPWRTSRLPYAYTVMDALSVADPCREVIVMKGAQLGFTEIGNCWLGYIMACVPAPVLAVQPDLKLARNFSRQRIDTLIETSPALRNLVSESKSRDSANTIFSKDFPGGMLVIGGSNSAAGLRSMPIRYLFLDEIDGYAKNVENEGSPIKLAEARTRTYQNKKKIYKISTPTVEGASAIADQFERSSKERYYVPCPHCTHPQILLWEQIKYDPEAITDTVHYECVECRGKIYEHHKTEMLKKGTWIADNPDEIYVRGFHISSLYSPVGFMSWAQCAEDYEEARKDPTLMQSFVNTTLGLCYRETGETPDYQRLYERREDYRPGMLPLGATILCAGIDVQKDRLELALVAYGKNKERWLVDYKVFLGDIEQDACWDDCQDYLDGDFPIEGSPLTTKIPAFAIDSGFANLRVSAFAKRFNRNRCYMIKGVNDGAVFIGSARQGEVKLNNKKVKTGLRVWNIVVSMAKDELYRQLMLPAPADGQPHLPGYFHFHRFVSQDWFKGLCSEELRTKVIKGFTTYYYEKVVKRNEPLDTVVYSRASFAIMGGDRWKDSKWLQLEEDLGRDPRLVEEARVAEVRAQMEMAVTPVQEEHVPDMVTADPVRPAKVRKPAPRRKSNWI